MTFDRESNKLYPKSINFTIITQSVIIMPLDIFMEHPGRTLNKNVNSS